MPTCLAPALGCALVLAFAAGPASAWSNNPAVNTPLQSGPDYQYVGLPVPDGGGGVYLVWQSQRGSNTDIYAQHLDAQGNRLWRPAASP